MMRNIEHFVFLITSILTLVLERLRATSTSDGKRYKYFTICTWYTRTWHIDIIRIWYFTKKRTSKNHYFANSTASTHHPQFHHISKKKHHPQIHGKQSFFFWRNGKQSSHALLLSMSPWSMGAIRQWSWVHMTIRWDELRARPPCSLPLCFSPPILSLPLLPASTGFSFSFSLFFSSHCNPFSLPRFLLSSFGDGPRNLTGTPPLQEPSTSALVGSIPLWIASRDRIARVSWFGRLGWFLALGWGYWGGIRTAVRRRRRFSW